MLFRKDQYCSTDNSKAENSGAFDLCCETFSKPFGNKDSPKVTNQTPAVQYITTPTANIKGQRHFELPTQKSFTLLIKNKYYVNCFLTHPV